MRGGGGCRGCVVCYSSLCGEGEKQCEGRVRKEEEAKSEERKKNEDVREKWASNVI